MLSISNLPLPNVVQYWVNICKIKLEFGFGVLGKALDKRV